MAKILGGNCKVYKCSTPLAAVVADDAFPTGTYTEMSKVIEVSVSDAKEDSDASDRTSLVDQSIPVGRKIEIEVKVHQDPAAGSDHLLFSEAYNAGTALTLAFFTGDKAVGPGEGFAANWYVSEKSKAEPRKEVVVVTYKLKVASYYGDYVVAAA